MTGFLRPSLLLLTLTGAGALGVRLTGWTFLPGYGTGLSGVAAWYLHNHGRQGVLPGVLAVLAAAAFVLLFAVYPVGGVPSAIGFGAGLAVPCLIYLLRYRRLPLIDRRPPKDD